MKSIRVWQLCVLAAIAATVALAADGYKAKPWTYDPDDTGLAGAAWVAKEGLLDAGGSKHALFLSKTTATTSVNAAGGAAIDLPAGFALNDLGFDYRNDSHCGAGAPRINVYTTSGTYFFGCSYGVHTQSTEGANWTRVRFSAQHAFPALSSFSSITVTGIDVVFDEGLDVGNGMAYLDNIALNGVLIGKPGIVQ